MSAFPSCFVPLYNHREGVPPHRVADEDRVVFVDRPVVLYRRAHISLPKDHPLAKQDSVSFADLRGMSILLIGSVGFWMDICLKHLDPANLLIQKSPDALYELIEASNLPHFNSDRMLDRHGDDPDRIALPISDNDAHAAFYIACLNSEKKKYDAVFSAARETVLRGT